MPSIILVAFSEPFAVLIQIFGERKSKVHTIANVQVNHKLTQWDWDRFFLFSTPFSVNANILFALCTWSTELTFSWNHLSWCYKSDHSLWSLFPLCISSHLCILNFICHFTAESLSLEWSFCNSPQSALIPNTMQGSRYSISTIRSGEQLDYILCWNRQPSISKK